MATLTERDKRTLRIGGIILAAYLVLFFGVKGWRSLENSRANYQKLVQDARLLKQRNKTYEIKAEVLNKLRGDSGIELSKLAKSALVAKTSEALQKAAMGGGVKLGPIRESPGNAANGEISMMRLEAVGPVAGVLAFIHEMQSLGCPVLIDALQISSDNRQPGMLKVNVDLVVLDYEKWQQKGKSTHA